MIRRLLPIGRLTAARRLWLATRRFLLDLATRRLGLTPHPERNRQHELSDGVLYARFYTCPTGFYADSKPAMGSLMSGESGLLGARIVRIKRATAGLGAADGIEILYRSFHAAAGGVSETDYAEIRPRRFRRTLHERQVTTTAIATDETHAPARGDVLNTDHAYTCTHVRTRKQWLPSRTLVVTTYGKPMGYAE